MQAVPWEKRLLRIVGWTTILAAWGGYAALKWLDLRDGLITNERFGWSVAFMSAQVALMVGVQAHQAWRARQPKSPPVYRSTILD